VNNLRAARPLLFGADGVAADPLADERLSQSFWRSLFLFNCYRLTVALVLVVVALMWGDRIQFGSRNTTLFMTTAALYAVFSIICFALIRIRWRFNLQLGLEVAADAGFVVVLMYASNGISSGLGLLLLTTLAGAGLISRGRLTLFHAATASIAVLLEQTYEVLRFDADVAQFLQAGLLSAAYFATGWVAYALSQYTLASERLAAQRGIDLQNMAQVNQHVIQDMQDGVIVVDAAGVIRQHNVRAERMLGSLAGRREVALSAYSPILSRHFEKWCAEKVDIDASAGGNAIGRSLAARFVPIGKLRSMGAVIFLEDLTRVQSQARQLKLASLGRLTANIAHEIRNPLGAISHAAELLREEPSVSDTVTRLVSIIHDNARRIDRMVNDVLSLNRGERARKEQIDLVDFVKSFIEQFTGVEKLAPQMFVVELTFQPIIWFDRNQLNQVLWNLCRNAVRHCTCKPGSIRIVIGVEYVGTVKLDVVDDGPGVTPEARGQLFEPFFTTSAGGTGLGLYIARELCEANGATLDCMETVRGAQFTLMCRAG
jgi:two-component system sensor histidine kinase PilS (NtrC family)